MQSRLQHGDENEEKGASLSRSIPSMAAVYATIGIGKRHTGQACVLGPLLIWLCISHTGVHLYISYMGVHLIYGRASHNMDVHLIQA
jgi:hypothetical protein